MIIVKKNTLQLIGNYVISKIIERTSQGIDEEGKPFVPYSIYPLSMPYGAYKYNTTKRQRDALESGDKVIIYQKKNKLRVLILGGYLEFKIARTGDKKPNLQYRGMRGGMLGDLTIVKAEDNYVIIGFKHEESARIASYHQILGAGKSKVIRKFLGLTDNEKQQIIEILKDKINFYVDGENINI